MDRIRRRVSTLLVAVVLAALGTVAPAAPADAASGYLCTGYAPCQEQGYSHAGYRGASDRMWWRMYAGHNCTNYVAYRMVKGGLSAERPWSGTGMAWNWGRANARITDDRPMVGAVAWWKANAPGTGSSGHVAYVEKVISATKIVISEDSWSGDFHWRRLHKSDGRWPTGFIHFNDREIDVVARPTITGTAAVGRTLTATTGSWSPSAERSLQWLADGKPLAGATSPQLTLTPGLRGSRLSVRVTAQRRGYVGATATSPATTRVTRGTFETLAAPAITGTVRVGEVLTLDRGSWSPAPDSVSVRWFANGQRIAGAEGSQLRLDQPQIGKRITVRTTARREAYHRSPVTSPPTVAVAAGRFEITRPFGLDGVARMGRRVTVAPGIFAPSGASVTYTWLRNGKAVSGADQASYVGAEPDVGERLSVRIDLRHPGYRDHSVLLAAPDRVTTSPALKVRTVGRRGRAVVKLAVTAPGVETARGRATVRIGGKQVSGRLEDGRLRVVLRDVAAGRRTVRVAYAGTEVILPGRASAPVEVRRPRR